MRFNAYTLFLLIILLIRPVFGYDELTVELNSPVTQLVRGEPLYVVINANNQSEQRVKIRYEVFASDNGIDFVHIEANDMIDKHSTFIRPNSSRNIAFLHLWAYYSHQFKNHAFELPKIRRSRMKSKSCFSVVAIGPVLRVSRAYICKAQ